MVEHIELFGKILEIDDGRLLDMKLHYEMIKKAEKASAEIEEVIKKCKNLDEFISVFQSLAPLMYKALADECVEYLAKLDVKDVDPLDFVKCDGNSLMFEDFFELEESYSELRRQYNLDKDIEKSFTKSLKCEVKERYKKNAFMDIYGWIPKMEEYIRYDGEYIVEISIKDEERAVGLFESLKNKGRSNEERYALAFDMFNLDPTEREYYEYCITEFPEQVEGLTKLYRLAGYNFKEETLQKAIETIFERKPHKTEEDLLDCKKHIEGICSSINLHNSVTLNKISKLLTDIDIQERTFENILFETREEKAQAQNDYSEIVNFCGSIEEMSEEICDLNKQKIINGEYNAKIKVLFIDKLDGRIHMIWEGEDDTRCKEIFLNTDITKDSALKKSMQEILEVGRTERKEKYIQALNSINAQTPALIKEYQELEATSFVKKYGISVTLLVLGILLISSIGIILIGVGGYLFYKKHKYIQEVKQQWNVLTVDGTAVHPMLLNENSIAESVPMIEENSICPGCGKTILETSRFCQYCGFKLKDN